MISIERQLSVVLDNRPGTLARICQAIAKQNINIRALSIAETVDQAVVRMVVSDVKKVTEILAALHVTAQEREVIFMEVSNLPGILAHIAEKLTAAGINIEYAYCTGAKAQETGAMVLRTSDIEATVNVLA